VLSVVPNDGGIDTLHDEDRRAVDVAAVRPEAETGAASQPNDGVNRAAAQVELPSFLRGVFEQFAQPSGWLGGLAGLLMARTANDDRWVVDLLDVQPSDRVLDVGCGPGVTLQLLAERAYSGCVAGVDPSPVMLRQASRRNRLSIAQGRLELRRATAAELPYPDGSFSKACALHSIYFWPSLEQGLNELQRVLSPASRLVLAVRLRHANASRLDPSRYGLTDDEVDAIVRTLETLGYEEVNVKRQEGLDRQTMAAIIARR
jgi:SAM-dependent methyltransferase